MSNLERLRTLVFGHPNPSASPFLPQLLQAESMVAKSISAPGPSAVLRSWPGSPDAGSGGIVWDTTASDRGMRGPALGSAGSSETGLQVTARLRMAHVPSSVIHLLDATQHPLVTMTVANPHAALARLRLRAVVEGYSAPAIETVDIPAGSQAEVSLLPTFFPERLAAQSEICRATLHLCIDDLEGKTVQERTCPIWLLPRSTAILYVPDPATGTRQDLTRYLAAYVTPNAPGILELLRRSASELPGGSVASYQVDAQGVQAQVAALYETLRGAGLAYVNSVLLAGAIPGVLGQRIRLPRESIAQRSANCIDGVVLLASLLEAASLNPAVVLLPGHALLGWETGESSDEWDYLETTLMGSAPFDVAHAAGRSLADKYVELARSNPQKFRRLSVRALREQGIWPME